jgi:hypothetical protein
MPSRWPCRPNGIGEGKKDCGVSRQWFRRAGGARPSALRFPRVARVTGARELSVISASPLQYLILVGCERAAIPGWPSAVREKCAGCRRTTGWLPVSAPDGPTAVARGYGYWRYNRALYSRSPLHLLSAPEIAPLATEGPQLSTGATGYSFDRISTSRRRSSPSSSTDLASRRSPAGVSRITIPLGRSASSSRRTRPRFSLRRTSSVTVLFRS